MHVSERTCIKIHFIVRNTFDLQLLYYICVFTSEMYFVLLKGFCMFHSLFMYTSVLGIKILVQACHANGCQTCTPLDETHFLCASSYLLHCAKLQGYRKRWTGFETAIT